MLPHSATCEECGSKAPVRGYGRIEYAWDGVGDLATTLQIRSLRLTIDCPTCGLLAQDYFPDGKKARPHAGSPSHASSPPAAIRRTKVVAGSFRS
jgi:hypothetical protein